MASQVLPRPSCPSSLHFPLKSSQHNRSHAPMPLRTRAPPEATHLPTHKRSLARELLSRRLRVKVSLVLSKSNSLNPRVSLILGEWNRGKTLTCLHSAVLSRGEARKDFHGNLRPTIRQLASAEGWRTEESIRMLLKERKEARRGGKKTRHSLYFCCCKCAFVL